MIQSQTLEECETNKVIISFKKDTKLKRPFFFPKERKKMKIYSPVIHYQNNNNTSKIYYTYQLQNRPRVMDKATFLFF